MNSISNSSWKFAVAAFAFLNLLLIIPANSFAIKDKLDSTVGNTLVIDGRGPSTHSSTTIFTFMASGLCSKTTEQCMEINGKGKVRFNDELRASGQFIKYKEGGQFRAPSYYTWQATELVNANAIHVHFKAVTGLGNINIALTEGKEPTSGLVCIWGNLEGLLGPNEVLCTNKVVIYIT
ncbi:MAG: hypothetical protein QXU32_02950 [Nitrososphaerales archaeon]